MPLPDAVQYFTEEDGALACMSIACGTAEASHTAEGGVMSPGGPPISPDSIFDLASLSKLFTALTAMRLWEQGRLNLQAQVRELAPAFRCIGDITVAQTLCFERAIRTPERVDAQPDPRSAEQTLFQAESRPNEGIKAYSDMHAMVIRYVLEAVTGQPLMDTVAEELLRPLGMKETWCRVPEPERHRCVSCDREHRIEGSRWFVREGIAPGTPHDPKARAMAPEGEVFCGHAGLFSTRGDMIRLCQGVLRGDAVRPETLVWMAENRTGHPLAGGGWTQFLGCLCYVRHPVQRNSEVPVYMGDTALALSGFTGNHLAIDPARGLFEFYLGSRVQNRLTVLLPEPGRERISYGLEPDGRGAVNWPGEGPVRSSVDFVYRKDAHYHPAVAETLGL